MSRYLDFENEKYQKGYELFQVSKKSIKENIGKRICYLLSRDYDRTRGYMTVRYGTIISTRYNQLTINENGDTIDITTILEAGIKIETV